MTRLWIVRHGNTFEAEEPPRRIGARTDLPLVASGRAQAEALARHFSATRFDRVLASRLARSAETARTIAGRDPETRDWLDEIDHGPDEDRAEADVVERIGADAIARWDARAEPPPGWIVDAAARIAGWRAMLDAASGDTLAVTSNGAARFALLAVGATLPSLKLRTGAWGLLADDGDGWRVVEWDRRPEDGAALPTRSPRA